jgi:hypothetical protein
MELNAFFVNQHNAFALTGIAIISYILSALANSPIPDSIFDCVKGLIQKYRCKANILLFLPGVFVLENGVPRCTIALTHGHLRSIFPAIDLRDVATTHAGDRIECDTLRRILVIENEFPLENLRRFRCPNSRMYEDSGATRSYASTTLNIFEKYGFSNKAVLLFYQTFFDEWFTLLSKAAFAQDVTLFPNFKFLSRHQCDYQVTNDCFKNPINIISTSTGSSDYTQKFMNLLPLPARPIEGQVPSGAIKRFVKLQYKKWEQYGSRAVYLQQFLNAKLTYDEIKHFREKLLAVHILWSRYTPIVSNQKISVNNNGHNFRFNDTMEMLETMAISTPATEEQIDEIIRCMVYPVSSEQSN